MIEELKDLAGLLDKEKDMFCLALGVRRKALTGFLKVFDDLKKDTERLISIYEGKVLVLERTIENMESKVSNKEERLLNLEKEIKIKSESAILNVKKSQQSIDSNNKTIIKLQDKIKGLVDEKRILSYQVTEKSKVLKELKKRITTKEIIWQVVHQKNHPQR